MAANDSLLQRALQNVQVTAARLFTGLNSPITAPGIANTSPQTLAAQKNFSDLMQPVNLRTMAGNVGNAITQMPQNFQFKPQPLNPFGPITSFGLSPLGMSKLKEASVGIPEARQQVTQFARSTNIPLLPTFVNAATGALSALPTNEPIPQRIGNVLGAAGALSGNPALTAATGAIISGGLKAASNLVSGYLNTKSYNPEAQGIKGITKDVGEAASKGADFSYRLNAISPIVDVALGPVLSKLGLGATESITPYREAITKAAAAHDFAQVTQLSRQMWKAIATGTLRSGITGATGFGAVAATGANNWKEAADIWAKTFIQSLPMSMLMQVGKYAVQDTQYSAQQAIKDYQNMTPEERKAGYAKLPTQGGKAGVLQEMGSSPVETQVASNSYEGYVTPDGQVTDLKSRDHLEMIGKYYDTLPTVKNQEALKSRFVADTGYIRINENPREINVQLGARPNSEQLSAITQLAGDKPINIDTPTGSVSFANVTDFVNKMAPLSLDEKLANTKQALSQAQYGDVTGNTPITQTPEYQAMYRQYNTASVPELEQLVKAKYQQTVTNQTIRGLRELKAAETLLANAKQMPEAGFTISSDTGTIDQQIQDVKDSMERIKNISNENRTLLSDEQLKAMRQDNYPQLRDQSGGAIDFSAPVGNTPMRDVTDPKEWAVLNGELGAQPPLYDVKKMEQSAIKTYGTTNVPESASFVTSDGKIIDSSGKKLGSMSEGRNVDHREIAVSAIPDNVTTKGMSGSDALSYFMDKTNATRVNVMPDEINIDTIRNLSDAQLKQLEKLSQGKTIVADISKLDGSVAKSGTFKTFSEYKNWLSSNFSSPLSQSTGATGKYPDILGFQNTDTVTPIKSNGKIVGGIDATVDRFDPQRLNVHRVMIIPEEQGKGLGTDAINQLFKENPDINQISGHFTAESKSFWEKIGADLNDKSTNFTITRPSTGADITNNKEGGFIDFGALFHRSQTGGDTTVTQAQKAEIDQLVVTANSKAAQNALAITPAQKAEITSLVAKAHTTEGNVPQVFKAEKFNVTDKQQKILTDLQDQLGLKTRPVQSFEDMQALGNELGADPARLLKDVQQGNLSAGQVSALGDQISTSTKRITQLVNEFKATDNQDILDQITKEQNTLSTAVSARIKGGTEAGRAVVAYRMLANATLDPAFWMAKAQRQVGIDKPLDAETINAISTLIEKGDKTNLARFVATLGESDGVVKAMSLWKAFILSSPTTRVGIASYDAALATTENIKDVPATAFDWVRNKLTGAPRTNTVSLEQYGMQPSAFVRGLGDAKDVLLTGVDPYTLDVNETAFSNQLRYGDSVGGKLAQKFTDLTFRSMGAAEAPFARMAFVKSLIEQAKLKAINGEIDPSEIASLITNPTQEMAQVAQGVAEFNTGSQANQFSTAIMSGKGTFLNQKSPQGSTLYALSNFVLPFTKKPVNAMADLLAYTPVGIIKDTVYKIISNGAVSDRQLADSFGRSVTGAGILAVGAALSAAGRLSGPRPTSATVRAQDTLENKSYNSILINGQWRPLDRLGYIGDLLSMAQVGYDTHSLAAVGATGLNIIGNLPMLMGLSQSIAAITNPQNASTYLEKFVSGFVPRISGVTAKSMDQFVRSPKGYTQSIANQIPLLRTATMTTPHVVSSDAPKTPLETVGLYVKGVLTDPQNTIKALFTDETLRKVSGDAAILERKSGLNTGQKQGMIVDHIIPLSLGGDNSPSNLVYQTPQAAHAKDVLEVQLGKDLASGKITKQEAQAQIKAWADRYGGGIPVSNTVVPQDQLVPVKLNPLGEPIKQEGGFQNLWNPFVGRTANTDPLVAEFKRVGYALSYAGRTANGQPLSQDNQQKYQIAVGDAIKQVVPQMMKTNEYISADTGTQKTMIDKAVATLKNEVRKRLFPSNEVKTAKVKTQKTLSRAKISTGKLAAIKTIKRSPLKVTAYTSRKVRLPKLVSPQELARKNFRVTATGGA